ncbi:MAG: DUF4231 domain-containing protein [Nocardioides sp.]
MAEIGTRRIDDHAWERLGNQLPAPDFEDPPSLVWRYVAAYFEWYSRGATYNRVAYQVGRVATLLLAAAVTVLAATGAPAALSASLAAAIVVIEGVQQLFQWHRNWISYRASAETLRTHAFAYAARIAPYDGEGRAGRLAAKLSELTERENVDWAGTMTSGPTRTPEAH